MEGFLDKLAISIKPTLAHWYISVIPILLSIVMVVLNIRKIKSVLALVGDTIKSKDDLTLIKEAINFNMKIAAISAGLYILFFVGVGLFIFSMQPRFLSILIGANHFIFFGIVIVIIGLYNGRFEKKLKNLPIISEEQSLRETYERWLKQWKKKMWRLPQSCTKSIYFSSWLFFSCHHFSHW